MTKREIMIEAHTAVAALLQADIDSSLIRTVCEAKQMSGEDTQALIDTIQEIILNHVSIVNHYKRNVQ